MAQYGQANDPYAPSGYAQPGPQYGQAPNQSYGNQRPQSFGGNGGQGGYALPQGSAMPRTSYGAVPVSPNSHPQGSPIAQRRSIVPPYNGMSNSSESFQTSSNSGEEWDLNSRSRTPSDQELDNAVPDAKLTKRQLLIREIVRTEHSYVRDLGKVIHLYLKPLWQKNVLTEEETTILFSNIEALYGINLKIANALQAARRPNGSNVDTIPEESIKVADVFVSIIPSLSIYTDYCDNHDKAVELLSNLSKKNKAFAEHEAELAASPDCQGLFLKDFLIKPVQRICKYPLLFKNLAEMTPEGDPERYNVDQSFSLFEDIVISINQAKDTSMNASALARYDEILEGYSTKLSSDSRRYIRDGSALKAAAKKTDIQYLRKSDATSTTFILFNDKMILATPKGKKLSFQKEVPLHTLTIIDTELNHPDHDKTFLVESTEASSKTWILWWENPTEKRTWFKLLRAHAGKAKLQFAKKEATDSLYEISDDTAGDDKKVRRTSSKMMDIKEKEKEMKRMDSKKALTTKSSFVKGKNDVSSSPTPEPKNLSTSTPSPSAKILTTTPGSKSSSSHAPPPRVASFAPPVRSSSTSDIDIGQSVTPLVNPALGALARGDNNFGNRSLPQEGAGSSARPALGSDSTSPRRAASLSLDQVQAQQQSSPGTSVAARGRGFTTSSGGSLPSHMMTTGGLNRSGQPPPPPREQRSGNLPPPPGSNMQATVVVPQNAPLVSDMSATFSGTPSRLGGAKPPPPAGRDRLASSASSLPPPPSSAGPTHLRKATIDSSQGAPFGNVDSVSEVQAVSSGRSEFEFMRLQNELSQITSERNQLRSELERMRAEMETLRQQAQNASAGAAEELMYQLEAVQQQLQAVMTENGQLKGQVLRFQQAMNRPTGY